jgi:hypothetical protein
MRRLVVALVAAFALTCGQASAAPDTFHGNVVGGTLAGNGAAITNLNIANLTPLSGNVIICTTSGGIITGSCATATLTTGSANIGGNLGVGGTATIGGASYFNSTANVTGLVSGVQGFLAQGAGTVNTQGAWLMWNRTGSGTTYLVNQKGLGAGGISLGHSDTSNNYTQDAFLSELGTFSATLFAGSGANLTNLPISQLTPLATNVVVCTDSGGILTASCTGASLSANALTLAGNLTENGRIIALGGSSVGLSNGAYFTRVGSESALNVVSDYQSIQARNNGAASTLYLNPLGGTVQVGAATFTTRPAMSGGSVRNWGTTSGRSGTATLTLPNDGLTYDVHTAWKIAVVTDTGDVTGVTSTGNACNSFTHMNSAGYTSGNYTTDALCTAVGNGQTLTFTLSSGGGSSTGAGMWWSDAVAR